MAKSPNALKTISEVSEEVGVAQHVLRFWETKFSQLSPMKRGGGRRYYRPEDVALLRAINRLLYTDGLTIKGVQKLLRERGAKAIAGSGTEIAPGRAAPAETPPAAPADAGNTRPAPAATATTIDADMLRQLAAIRDRMKSALAEARFD